MKRFTAIFLCAALMLVSGSALANSWGLRGELYQAVSAVNTWDEYTLTGNQAGNAAVLHTQYHNVLMLLLDGKLQTYTRAVYQPDAKKKAPKLEKTEYGLILSYGQDESYTFERRGTEYYLESASVKGFTLSPNGDYHYIARDETGSVDYYRSHRLRDFNIALLPHSVAEVRQLNLLHAALESGDDCLGWFEKDEQGYRQLEGIGTGTAPVYSAPYGDAAWRAAKGKAAVGLNGRVWLLRNSCVNQDGEAYACIRYNVSTRTQRIGYVRVEALGGVVETPTTPALEEMIHVDVQATRKTYLTDDPDVSQYRQFTVPEGTQLTCIGLYDEDYAYVAAEVKDGKFVSGGSIVWGFVPLKDLELFDQGEIQQDVMQQLVGDWYYSAGGGMAAEYLTLRADGTYTGWNGWETEKHQGTWYVRKYNAFNNLYWDNPLYEITFLSEGGMPNIKGLTLEEEGFSLTNWEGSGGYSPMEGEMPDAGGDSWMENEESSVYQDEGNG